eukprot:6019406-Pyramimonas_sp.AAC.2
MPHTERAAAPVIVEGFLRLIGPSENIPTLPTSDWFIVRKGAPAQTGASYRRFRGRTAAAERCHPPSARFVSSSSTLPTVNRGDNGAIHEKCVVIASKGTRKMRASAIGRLERDGMSN